MECGYGTAIFLILMSSSVFVIRGEKASVWGSVYLDEFGEEDIDLRSDFYLIQFIFRICMTKLQFSLKTSKPFKTNYCILHCFLLKRNNSENSLH